VYLSSSRFRTDHNISIYKSYTLESGSWEYVGSAVDLSLRPPGVVFRPHCVYNPKTSKYVLWWNFGFTSNFAVAVADSPEGPFEMVTASVNITGGDFDILVDDDGTGYILYGHMYYLYIQRLTPDFYNVESPNAIYEFPPYFVEAPVFFKRNKIYYALFDWNCCFCVQGSGIQVWTSSSPTGPFVQQLGGDLACAKNTTPVIIDNNGCEHNDPTTTSTTRAQQTFVVQVQNSTLGVEYLWAGDRWQQAPDYLKGHDPQFWVPLTFNDSASPPTIQHVIWVDQIQF